jgi:hypothetical protein
VLYVAGLNASVACEQAQRGEKERADTQAAREPLTSLEERLAQLLAIIPVEMLRQGVSMPSLLRGRWRGNCHPGELGTALRKLGFKRERRWHDEGGFKAVWRKQG